MYTVANSQGGVIVNKLHPTNNLGEYCLFLQPDGVVIFWQIDMVASGNSSAIADTHTSLHTLATQTPLLFDRFNHIAVTSDGLSLSIYINGNLAARAAAIRSGSKTVAPLLLGSSLQEDHPAQIFQGIIEEIRIWDRAKNHAEIGTEMNHSAQSSLAGLVGHWRFDIGQGITVDDLSSHKNQGVLAADLPENYPSWCPPELWIGKGRCYVDGLLCENEFDIPFSQQPNAPSTKLPNLGDSVPLLIYLDVWQRLITAIQDPNIREIALGGPDTATRTQIVWQVKALPASVSDWLDNEAQWKGSLCMRKQPSEQIDGNFLYRVEIHNGGVSYGQRSSHGFLPSLFATLKIERFFLETNKVQVTDWEWTLENNYIGQYIEIFDAASSCTGFLAQIVHRDINRKILTLNYLSSEVKNYKDPCLQQVATFKWSRENGAIAFPIERIEHQTVTLKLWIHDSFALKPGDWVELADDISVLQNRVFPLCQIVSINTTVGASIEIGLDRLPPKEIQCDATHHPLLRRWDQKGKQVESKYGVIPIKPDVWLALENGIQVCFKGRGFFRSGDYWWTPARIISQTIEWPEIKGIPIAQAPIGIQHHYIPLAWLDPNPFEFRLKDLRHFFGSIGTGFVRKTGDIMTGNLTIESSLLVKNNSIFEGDLEVGTLHGSLAPEIVSTEQILDRAITISKLSPQVGIVPPRFMILGRTQESPIGYSFTGSQLNVSPTTSHWENLPIQLPQTGHVTSVSLNNKIYVLFESGEMWSYGLQTTPDKSPWSQEKNLLQPLRYAYAVTALGDAIYVIGGYERPHHKSKRVEAYYPDRKEWSIKARMPTARSHLGVGIVNGKLFALGGFESVLWGRYHYFKSRANEMYDPVQDRWISLCPLPLSRSRLGVTSLGGKLYALGGVSSFFLGILGNRITKRADVYSPLTNSWSKAASLPTAKVDVIAVTAKDEIYAFGREAAQRNTDRIDVYNLTSNRWFSEIPLGIPRHHYGVVFEHGFLYIIGGIGVDGVEDSIARYQILVSYFFHVKEEA